MKISLKKILVYFALAIYIIGNQLLRINMDIPSKTVRMIQAFSVFVLVVNYFITTKSISYRATKLFVLLCPIVFVGSLPSRLTDILYLVIILWAIHMMDPEKLYRWCLVVTVLSVLVVLIFSRIGLLPNIIINQFGRVRNGLGFSSYTILPFQYLSLVFGYTYFRKKLHFTEMLILEVVGFVIYRATDVNTAFFLMSGYLVLVYLIKKKILKITIKLKWMRFMPPILTVVSLITLALYQHGNKYIHALNLILGGRFLFAARAVEKFGIHLFGNYIDWNIVNKTSYLIIDNAYINILVSYGVLGCVIVNYIYFYLIEYSVDNNNQVLFVIIMMTLLNGLLWARLLVFPEIEFVLFASTFFLKKIKMNPSCRKVKGGLIIEFKIKYL